MVPAGFDIDKLEKATAKLKAMAHPIRIAILKLLIDNDEMTVTQLHGKLSIEQSTTSHHLGILKDKGVLCSRREGKNTVYFLKHKILGKVIDCLDGCECED